LRLPLCFAELRDDLCSASLGTLLLRDGVVGASQASCRTVLARSSAITNAFDLSLMATIACALDGRCGGSSRVRHHQWHQNTLPDIRCDGGENRPVYGDEAVEILGAGG